MRAVGITYLDRKIRSITHTIPRVVLCRGRITAATLFKLKYSSGLGRPIRGQINELIQTFTSEDFPANWYPGAAVRGSIQTVGIIKGAYQATVGVPIAAKAISKTSARARAASGAGRAVKGTVKGNTYAGAKVRAGTAKGLMTASKSVAAAKAKLTRSTFASLPAKSQTRTNAGARLSIFTSFTYARGIAKATSMLGAFLRKSTQPSLPVFSTSKTTLGAKTSMSNGESERGAITTRATSRARIHQARRTKIADLMGKPISEYIGKTIGEVAWTEV